jgi:hypothetical protein
MILSPFAGHTVAVAMVKMQELMTAKGNIVMSWEPEDVTVSRSASW